MNLLEEWNEHSKLLTYDDRDDLELGTELLAELPASDYFSYSSFVCFGTRFLPEIETASNKPISFFGEIIISHAFFPLSCLLTP